MPFHYITCDICGQQGDVVYGGRTPPIECNLFCCNDLRKLLPHLRKQSFALRLTNRAQSDVMRDFPSPPLQFGNDGSAVRDAEAETDEALRLFILEQAHISVARSTVVQSIVVQ